MTEKEKMLAGMLYRADSDSELLEARQHAKTLCAMFNRLMPMQTEEREALLRRLLGRAGSRFWIEQDFWCDYGFNIELGENFYANHNLVILDCARVSFGKNCFIGPNCGFYTAGHPLDGAQRAAGLEYARPITVGDDVWFEGHVSVMPGVSIGNGSVIGGGSVVTHDIPEGVVAAGDPCRVLRPITEADRLPEGVLLR